MPKSSCFACSPCHRDLPPAAHTHPDHLEEKLEHQTSDELRRLGSQRPRRPVRDAGRGRGQIRGARFWPSRRHSTSISSCCGSHGYHGLDRVLGTVAAKVVNHADRDVLGRPRAESAAASSSTAAQPIRLNQRNPMLVPSQSPTTSTSDRSAATNTGVARRRRAKNAARKIAEDRAVEQRAEDVDGLDQVVDQRRARREHDREHAPGAGREPRDAQVVRVGGVRAEAAPVEVDDACSRRARSARWRSTTSRRTGSPPAAGR